MSKYDLAIIGGGPAGYVAAERAGANGLGVVLFEHNELGGVCLNAGCIPTKTMLNSTRILEEAREAEKFGISCGETGFDFQAISRRKKKVVKKLVGGVKAKMKHHGVEVVTEKATIESAVGGKIAVRAGETGYEADNLLVATGSEPAVPPIDGLEQGQVWTSSEALAAEEVPGSLTIIGGGVIGIEFADIFTSLGCKCTVIEMLDEIIPGIDTDAAVMLREQMAARSAIFHLSSRVTKLAGKSVMFEKDGETLQVDSEQVLLSVGRRPVSDGFGLENLGVEVERGGIKIDANCRTNRPNVYAAGDVTGFSLLAHTASREGEVAVNHILGRPDRMRYDAIPGVVYTHPEVASVGLTEQAAAEKGIEVQVVKLPMSYAGRFVAETERKDGFCKVIAGKEHGEILGVHMAGGHCSEMIYGACVMIEAELRIRDVREVVFPHPTVSEIIRETVFAF